MPSFACLRLSFTSAFVEDLFPIELFDWAIHLEFLERMTVRPILFHSAHFPALLDVTSSWSATSRLAPVAILELEKTGVKSRTMR